MSELDHSNWLPFSPYPVVCCVHVNQVPQVLQIMVQHVEDLTKWDITKLLQLSSACRRALQQAVGCLKVDQLHTVEATTGFAAWLPRHAGLLQELKLVRLLRAVGSAELAGDDASWAAVEQAVTFALQISSTPPGMPPGGPQPPSQHAPLLRLRSFTTSYVHSPAALHSLASCSTLTELTLWHVPPQRFTAAFCGAIGQLRSLRKLSCSAAIAQGSSFVYPCSFAAAVAQLTQLEELKADDKLPLAGLPQLPASLTNAYLDVAYTGRSPADVNISQLSRLHSLDLSILGRISAQSQLLGSLTALTLTGAADAVLGLGQLQRLNLPKPAACLPLMQRLPQLPGCST
jgi:hypothetical protein